jgi:hypothetical protein
MSDDDIKQAITPELEAFMVKNNFLQKPKVEVFTAYEYPEDVPEEIRDRAASHQQGPRSEKQVE